MPRRTRPPRPRLRPHPRRRPIRAPELTRRGRTGPFGRPAPIDNPDPDRDRPGTTPVGLVVSVGTRPGGPETGDSVAGSSADGRADRGHRRRERVDLGRVEPADLRLGAEPGPLPA